MKMFKTIMTMILAAATPLAAQETVAVTLDEAVSTALRQNNLLNAARMGVDKAVGMKKEADSYYFRRLT